MTQATRPQTAKILATRFTTIDKPDTPLAATMTAVRLPQHVHDLIAQYLPDGAKKAAWLREVIGSAAIAQFKPVKTEPQAAKVDHSDLERAILYLDSRCDGCETEDGRGFNGCDTNFGKWLAGKLRIGESLLQSHAVKALKMLQKYKNTQLIPAGFVLPKWEDIADRYPEANVIKREINGEVCTPKRLIQLKGESLAMFAPYDVTQKLQQRARELKGRFFRRDQGGDDSWRFELELEKIEQVLQQWPEPMYTHDPAIEGVLAALKADRDAEIAEQEAAALAVAESINSLVGSNLDAPLKNGWVLRDYQKRGVEWLLANIKNHIRRGGILADQMGLGKANPLDTDILTPSGFRKMGDLRVGDFVVGSDGRPTKVIGVYPQGIKPVYRVTFTDKSSTECCDEHLWAIRTPSQKSIGGRYKVWSLKQIMLSGLSQKNGNLKHYIPMTHPVQFDNQTLPIHPYVLGVLLGDGCLSGGSIQWTKPDPEIAELVARFLPDSVEVHNLDEADGDYSIVGKKQGSNYVLDELRKLGLIGCTAGTKFIPDCYKFASVEDRIALLQGLMDTDGSVSDKIILEYGSISRQLALDVQFLVQSFGGVARMTERTPWYTYKGEVREGKQFYRLNISLPNLVFPFKCQNKAINYSPRTKYQPSRGIKSIELVGEKECQCIAVDAPDHLYLTNDFIVTHNTLTAAYAAKKLQDRTGCTVFVVAPVSLQKIWARTAEMVELEVEITTNSYQKIFKPLEHKQYLLIADEAHKFQNPKAKCTVSFLELAKHDNCIGVWPLTGTPIKNGRPINLFPLLEAIDHPLARDKRKYEAYYCNAGMKKVNRHRTVWDVSGSSHLQELAANTKDAILQRTKAECLPELPAKTRLFKEAELSAETEREYKDKIASLVADYRDRAKLGLVDPDSEALATINILRGAGSIAKSEYAIELAEDLIDSNEQVVIFTEFLESAKIIAGRLGGLLLTGETKPEERQAMCDRFQAGEVKVIVGTIKAGGVGLTLTAASNVILVDRPWTPGDTEQAEDRCHRLGQQSAVFATWLQHGPIDAAIDGVIQLKQENIDIVMKGKKKTLNNVQSPKELARQLMAIL